MNIKPTGTNMLVEVTGDSGDGYLLKCSVLDVGRSVAADFDYVRGDTVFVSCGLPDYFEQSHIEFGLEVGLDASRLDLAIIDACHIVAVERNAETEPGGQMRSAKGPKSENVPGQRSAM